MKSCSWGRCLCQVALPGPKELALFLLFFERIVSSSVLLLSSNKMVHIHKSSLLIGWEKKMPTAIYNFPEVKLDAEFKHLDSLRAL
jgi:hypothetical protein